jgi:hypothetical protein
MPFTKTNHPNRRAMDKRIRRLAKELNLSAHHLRGRGWIITTATAYVQGYNLDHVRALALLEQLAERRTA